MDHLSALIEHEYRCSRARAQEQRCAAAECKRRHNEQRLQLERLQLQQRHHEQQLALQQQQLLQLHELQLQHGRQYAVQEEVEVVEEAEEDAAVAAAVVASSSSSSSSSLSSEVYEDEEPSRRLEQDQELLHDGEQHECAHAHAYAQQQQHLLQHLQEQQQHHQHGHHEAYPEQDEAFGADEAAPELAGREEADSVGSIDVELSEEDEQSESSEGDGEESQVGLMSPVKAEPSTGSVCARRPPCEDAGDSGKPECRRRWWSPEEDARLARIVDMGAHLLGETGKPNWKAVAPQFEGRSWQQCKQRSAALTRGLIKGKWTADEDLRLKEAVALHGIKWANVWRHVSGRTAKQCRDRYMSHVNPAIKLSAWTPEEEQTCVTAYRAYGNRWVAIQKLLPNRPWYTIKHKIGFLKKQGRIDE